MKRVVDCKRHDINTAIRIALSEHRIGEDLSLVFSGLERLRFYDQVDACIKEILRDKLKTVEIRDVKTIDRDCFYSFKALRQVICDGVEEIEDITFYCCKKLEEVKLSEGLKFLGHGAFYGTRIKDIVLPKSLVGIGYECFCDCADLATVIFSDTGTTPINIGDDAFRGCKKIEEVVIRSNIGELGAGAFRGCDRLKRVVIDGACRIIHSGAFCGCPNLEDVVINGNVKRIHPYVFSGCDSLKSVFVNGVVKDIEGEVGEKFRRSLRTN